MFIQQADLFREVDQETMNEISAIMVEQSYDRGAILFAEGDPADYFFILKEGRVRLAVGKEAEIDYPVSSPGEAFGWSSLVGRDLYTAQAECQTACKLIKIEGESLQKIFNKHPESGMIFFKRLAGAIGQRLIHTYNAFLLRQSPQHDVSYGTRQVMEIAVD
ncbi:MAG TPA: cyclic nucleotide-binding domain-containing protein [Desulfomonilaceae bacterium]|nr:cyclic nucleotide-binding domain-containing protein [Desulfomonilaceae bacterium]